MIRLGAAVFIAFHGIVHLLGFVTSWQLAEMRGLTYHTTVLNGAIDLGDGGARIVGLVWLALAVALCVAAFGIARDLSWATSVTATVAVASLVICVLGLPQAIMGIGVDVAILVVIASGSRTSRTGLRMS